MVLPITLLFCGFGFLIYKSKKEVYLVDNLHNDKSKEEDDDLYDDLKDLFI